MSKALPVDIVISFEGAEYLLKDIHDEVVLPNGIRLYLQKHFNNEWRPIAAFPKKLRTKYMDRHVRPSVISAEWIWVDDEIVVQ